MDINKVMKLLKQEEGPKLDFKQALHLVTESEKKELTKDVIAIANSRGGRGYIIFGIEDKTKKVIGVDPGDFKEEQIQQIIYNRCDPPVPISVDFIELDSRVVAVITIFANSHKPHQMLRNGAFYIRRGSTTDIARRGEIANLFQENGIMTYETVVLRNISCNELDYNLINKYFLGLNVISQNPSEILLETMGIIGRKYGDELYSPTIGGILLFGKNPSLYLPHVYVKVVMNEDVKIFHGNILTMLDSVTEYLRTILDEKNYPINALEEAIANALVHRDYLDNSRGVTLIINKKNIEISNPGALIAGNTVYKFIRENNPERRNSWLYQKLLTLDTKRRFMKSGIGISRIKKDFKKIGKVKFINIGSENLFKIILPI